MNRPGSNPPTPRINPAALEQARGLLSALFLGLRAAQIHEPSNRAFEHATALVFQSASALFTSTGGFSLQLGEEAAFLNGQRIPFEGSAIRSLRTLRGLLESAGLGGIEMRNPPTEAATRKLILLFSPGASRRPNREELEQAKSTEVPVEERTDQRIRAVRNYAKLILALRDQLSVEQQDRSPPRLRVTRIMQELVEIAATRPDYLLRLAAVEAGPGPAERHGAGAALLSIVLGRAFGLPRRELVDLGLAALLHHAGGGEDLSVTGADASIARLVRRSPVGPKLHLRVAISGERVLPAVVEPAGDRPPQVRPHLLSRIVAVASRYRQLTTGFGAKDQAPMSPPEALKELLADEQLDRRLVDLLINVLRVFPIGAEVLLDSGDAATVTEVQARWDRPRVQVQGEDGPRSVDLSSEDVRIEGTQSFLGKGDRQTFDEEEFPPIFTGEQLEDIGVESDELQIDVSLEEENELSDRLPVVPVAREMGEFETDDREAVTELSPIPEIEANEVEFIETDEDGNDLYEIVEPFDEDEETMPKTMLDGVKVVEVEPQPEPVLVPEPPTLSEIDELKQRLELRKQRENLRRQSRIHRIEAQLEAYRAEQKELEEEVKALREDATSASRLTESVKERHQEIDGRCAESDERIRTLEQQLDQLWKRRKSLGEEANDLEHKAATARSDASEAAAKAEEVSEEAADRAARIAELEAELSRLKSEKTELQQTADTFTNAAEEAKRLAKEAEAKAEMLREEIQASIPDLSAKEEELEQLRSGQGDLDEERAALAESVKNATALADEAAQRLADAEARISDSMEAIAELEAELARLSS